MHPKKSLSLIALALLLAAPLRAATEEKTAVPFRLLAFDAACATAKDEGKLVFIDFYTTWCEPCKRLDKDTWTNADVGKLVGEKAVALKIDAEKEKDLAVRYKINLYPTLLVVKADGKEVDRIEGYREPPAFTTAFTKVLEIAQAGKTGLEQAKEEVEKADADEAQPRFDLAKKLAKAGQSAEALKELTWCWDEGKKDPEFARTRSSMVARELGILARSYAPAKDAMIARRDDARSRAVAGKGGGVVIQDLIQLNKELKMDEDTVAVFDQLPEGDRRRVTISIYLFDWFLDKQRYKDATLFNMPETSTMSIERAKAQLKKGGNDGATASSVRFAITSTAKRVEALAGAGHLDEARDLADKLLTLDSSEDTRALLKTHATRAGHPELFASAPVAPPAK
jgi:thiol-disulfide isomerase/thioredoxin